MEFRIKSHKVYANGNGKLYTAWWTVQRRIIFIWATETRAVPYSILPEPIRFVKIEEAEAYVEEKLSRPRKFKVISEVI